MEQSNDLVVPSTNPPPTLSGRKRMLVLSVAFLGWLCAGGHMSITTVAMRSAAIDLLDRSTGNLERVRYHELNQKFASPKSRSKENPSPEQIQLDRWDVQITRWFAWCQCAFLFGAATGGLLFGWLGDKFGRSKGMAVSIVTYSLFAIPAYFVTDPLQLVICWFLACTGVGGMWPNGVALVSEAWSSLSRPMVAGLLGTAANVGIFLMATLAAKYDVKPDSWRWVMLVVAAAFPLGVFAWFAVPESPRWLAARERVVVQPALAISTSEVFRPPLLGVTLLGITLATIPLFGAWGSGNWVIPWADKAGQAADPPDPSLKARVLQARSITGILGSLLGGWIGSAVGRRRSYFLTSLAALGIAQYTFWYLKPLDPSFMFWVAALGFFSGIYFGWLPLFLPEMFPTRSRSTGAGVSFNFGRILTAVTVFTTGALTQLFGGDLPRLGRITSLIFVLGMVAIWFAPNAEKVVLED